MKSMQVLKTFFSKTFASLKRGFKRPFGKARPPADGLLADAVRIAELPSPVEREEPRVQYVVERLKRAGIECRIDQDGNAVAVFPAPGSLDPRPVLVHACIGTRRWHPLRSLSRLGASKARGAGLADALPAAVLLGLAEAAAAGVFASTRNLVVAFMAGSSETTGAGAYARLLEYLGAKPEAAVGLRGTGLAAVSAGLLGAARFSVSISAGSASKKDRGASTRSSAVSLAAELIGRLEGVRWDATGATSCRVVKVEAGSGFGRPPIDAEVEIELESADQGMLDLAVEVVRATSSKTGEASGAAVKVAEASRLPVPDARLSTPLAALVRASMKELRIRATESIFADPSGFLSSRGIPATSLGVSEAAEGFEQDELEIATLGAGYKLAELVLGKLLAASPSGAGS